MIPSNAAIFVMFLLCMLLLALNLVRMFHADEKARQDTDYERRYERLLEYTLHVEWLFISAINFMPYPNLCARLGLSPKDDPSTVRTMRLIKDCRERHVINAGGVIQHRTDPLPPSLDGAKQS